MREGKGGAAKFLKSEFAYGKLNLNRDLYGCRGKIFDKAYIICDKRQVVTQINSNKLFLQILEIIF